MKRKFIKYPISASTSYSSRVDDMIENMYYQTLENYGDDLSDEDLKEVALEHVIMYIEDMDGEREFSDYLPQVNSEEFKRHAYQIFDGINTYPYTKYRG